MYFTILMDLDNQFAAIFLQSQCAIVSFYT